MRYGFVVSRTGVPKPATQRPTLPSAGRLGLVEPTAAADLLRLGWNTDAHIELLWSLSRAADADAALRTLVRLADALDTGWDELATRLLTDKSLRGRLFALLGSSLALGDHLVANPQSWQLLGDTAGRMVELPSAAELKTAFTECAARNPQPAAGAALRTLYRDRLMVLAALDVAPTVENERVLPFATIGEHLSDLADAALAAALEVAVATVCTDGPAPRLSVIAMGKCGVGGVSIAPGAATGADPHRVALWADERSHCLLGTLALQA